MTRISAHRLAKVAKLVVSLLMICTIVGMVSIPAMVLLTPEGFCQGIMDKLLHLMGIKPLPAEQAELYIPLWWTFAVVLVSWGEVWSQWVWIAHMAVMMLCAVSLWIVLRQARDVLDAILSGEPFRRHSADAMRRASYGCWVIAGGALAWLIAEVCLSASSAPLYGCHALLIPVFWMAGLLLLLLSALFRQAAELQEDQDLTI